MAAKRRTIDPHTNPAKRGTVKQQKNSGEDRATQRMSPAKRQSEK